MGFGEVVARAFQAEDTAWRKAQRHKTSSGFHELPWFPEVGAEILRSKMTRVMRNSESSSCRTLDVA